MSATRGYLEMVAKFLEGPSLAKLVLDYARPVALKASVPNRYQGRVKECYRNAALMVLDDPRRYAYMEGYASSVIPVQHAWVYDRRDRALIDPTWRDKIAQNDPEEYVGLMFRTAYLTRYVAANERAGLLDDPDHAYRLATDVRLRKRALMLA